MISTTNAKRENATPMPRTTKALDRWAKEIGVGFLPFFWFSNLHLSIFGTYFFLQ